MTQHLTGPGLNTHAQRLPVAACHSLGIGWFRADLPSPDLTVAAVQAVLAWYHSPVLWCLSGDAADLPQLAKLAQIATMGGCQDIEVFNEPDMAGISPADFVAAFQRVRDVVPKGTRLYGPSCMIGSPIGGKFPKLDTGYLMDCLNAGLEPDGLSIHGYWVDPRILAGVAHELEIQTGFPVMISETGYPAKLGQIRYPYSDPVAAFKELRATMGSRGVCWYDGPQPSGDDPNVGLFAENPVGSGVWNNPTATLHAIAPAVAASLATTVAVAT